METKIFDIKEQNGMKKRFYTIGISLTIFMLLFCFLLCSQEGDLDLMFMTAGILMLTVVITMGLIYIILIAPKQVIIFRDGKIFIEIKNQSYMIAANSKETISLINIGGHIAIKIIPYGVKTQFIDYTIIKYLVKYCNDNNIPLTIDRYAEDHVYGLINAENLNELDSEIVFEKEKTNLIKKIWQIVIIVITFIAVLFIAFVQQDSDEKTKIPKITVPENIEIPEISIPKQNPEINVPEIDIPEIPIPNIELPNNKMND